MEAPALGLAASTEARAVFKKQERVADKGRELQVTAPIWYPRRLRVASGPWLCPVHSRAESPRDAQGSFPTWD